MQNKAANIEEYLKGLSDWQIGKLTAFRELIHKVSPEISEEIKWGVPVFLYKGKTLFSMAAFKDYTKYNFMHNGAELTDNKKLFNNGLESKRSRSIDIREGQSIDLSALEDLMKESIRKV